MFSRPSCIEKKYSTLRLPLQPLRMVTCPPPFPLRRPLFLPQAARGRRETEPSRNVLHIPVPVTQPSDQSKPRTQCTYLRRTWKRYSRSQAPRYFDHPDRWSIGRETTCCQRRARYHAPLRYYHRRCSCYLAQTQSRQVYTQCCPDWAETTDSHAPSLHVCCTMCRSRKPVPSI